MRGPICRPSALAFPPSFPRRACPREDGGRNPSPPPPRCPSRMRGPILVPHPISRRGSPRGPPSLTFTPAPSPHPYPLSSRMRGPIPVPTRRACPRENGGGNPSSSPTQPHVGASLVAPFPDIHTLTIPALLPFFPRRACPREDGAGTHLSSFPPRLPPFFPRRAGPP